MNKKTATAIALVLGLATPFALSGAAMAVDVTFVDGDVLLGLSSEEAETACGEAMIVNDACDSTLTLAQYQAGLEGDEEGPGSENSAAALAPGHVKGEGESAREYAPGQQMQASGGSATDYAPGQVKQGNGG